MGTRRGGSARFCPASAETAPDLKVVYGIEGETNLAERVVKHLEGYRQSQPVRRGNAACTQFQLDIFGEILDWSLLYQSSAEASILAPAPCSPGSPISLHSIGASRTRACGRCAGRR